jgi:phosphoribosylglycinamide formyltransferase-1
MKIGFLASGQGSNMQAIIDACEENRLQAEPVIVISNNGDSKALARARDAGIAAICIGGPGFQDEEKRDAEISNSLLEHGAELIILAGYMRKIGPKTLAAYKNRILNIHPALLPKYGGQGMYGRRIHEAVLEAGEEETGITIHVIDGQYDTGPILAQESIAIDKGDTVDTLSKRVLNVEHEFYVKTLARIINGEILLP